MEHLPKSQGNVKWSLYLSSGMQHGSEAWPCLCVYVGWIWNKLSLNTFKARLSQPQLLYYKRYIDDIFGIWVPPNRNRLATWNAFKTALNNWGKLEWVIEEPFLKTTFLDLKITIEGSSFITLTYQKIYESLSLHPTFFCSSSLLFQRLNDRRAQKILHPKW